MKLQKIKFETFSEIENYVFYTINSEHYKIHLFYSLNKTYNSSRKYYYCRDQKKPCIRILNVSTEFVNIKRLTDEIKTYC